MKEKLQKMDRAVLGVIVGSVLTVVGFLLYYPIYTRGTDVGFMEYCQYAKNGANRQDIMIFCMLPNMLLFYFTNFRWNLSEFTKGLVAVTLLLGLLLVILTVI